MFVGTTGVDRVVERTAQVMREHDTDDVAGLGVIPLPVIQKYLNFHYSVSLDLFGGETSTNVANYYTAGLKGRWLRTAVRTTTSSPATSIMVDALTEDGEIGQTEVSALIGLNTDLRREYIADCQSGVKRWNRILDSGGPRQPAAAAARRIQPQGGCVRRDRGHTRRQKLSARRSGSVGRARGCRRRWTRRTCGR